MQGRGASPMLPVHSTFAAPHVPLPGPSAPLLGGLAAG